MPVCSCRFTVLVYMDKNAVTVSQQMPRESLSVILFCTLFIRMLYISFYLCLGKRWPNSATGTTGPQPCRKLPLRDAPLHSLLLQAQNMPTVKNSYIVLPVSIILPVQTSWTCTGIIWNMMTALQSFEPYSTKIHAPKHKVFISWKTKHCNESLSLKAS